VERKEIKTYRHYSLQLQCKPPSGLPLIQPNFMFSCKAFSHWCTACSHMRGL